VQAVQRLEGALQDFIGGDLDDDVAILAISPAAADEREGRGISISSAREAATDLGAIHG
jgi:hypothetical protein